MSGIQIKPNDPESWRQAMEKLARERDAWRSEALAARQILTILDTSNYEQKIYWAACKATDELINGAQESRTEGMDFDNEFNRAITS